jgi:sugar (pentulose or hexulose) kinase
VHLDQKGNVLTPLYNYTKPMDQEILDLFYEKHGSKLKIARETASPQAGMLNSGLQLFWLKYKHPEIFKRLGTAFICHNICRIYLPGFVCRNLLR